MRDTEKISDETLVKDARSGSTKAFDVLVERYFGMVFAIALARLGHRETAEDLAQETFLRAWLFLDRLDRPERFSAWIARIARNLAFDWGKRGDQASRLLPLVPLETVIETVPDSRSKDARDQMESDKEIHALREAIRALSPEQRELVLLHFMEEMPQQQIADRLGVDRSTVSRHLAKALHSMKKSLIPILREPAPRLWAPKRAMARTLAILAAASALSGAQKAALAAKAGESIAAISAPLSSAKSIGSVLSLSKFIQSIPATLAAGGKLMSLGKGLAIGITAIAVVIGGAHYLSQSRKGGGGVAPAIVSAANGGPTLSSPAASEVARIFTQYQKACRNKDFEACASICGLADAASRQREINRIKSIPEFLDLIAAAMPYSIAEYVGKRYKTGKQPLIVVEADDFEWFFQETANGWKLISQEFFHNAAAIRQLIEKQRTQNPNGAVKIPSLTPSEADLAQALAAFRAYQEDCRTGRVNAVLDRMDFKSALRLTNLSITEAQVRNMVKETVTPSLMAAIAQRQIRSNAVGLKLQEKIDGPVILLRGNRGWAWYFHKTDDGWKLISLETRDNNW